LYAANKSNIKTAARLLLKMVF